MDHRISWEPQAYESKQTASFARTEHGQWTYNEADTFWWLPTYKWFYKNVFQHFVCSGLESFPKDDVILHREMSELRVFKTDEEIEVLRYVNRASSDAHCELMREIRPGMQEYQCEAIFRNHVYSKGLISLHCPMFPPPSIGCLHVHRRLPTYELHLYLRYWQQRINLALWTCRCT